jgi:hypothetical protein
VEDYSDHEDNYFQKQKSVDSSFGLSEISNEHENLDAKESQSTHDEKPFKYKDFDERN